MALGSLAVALAAMYMIALVVVAQLSEHFLLPAGSAPRLKRWLPALALGVYCSSWTYYGAVGRAVEAGWSYLPIYVGPILVYTVGFPILVRIHKCSKEHGSGSVADLLALRYGKRRAVAVIATLIACGAALPYIGLQLKAVAQSLRIVGLDVGPNIDILLVITAILGVFASFFGTRSRETTDRRPAIVAAIALESFVKLLALAAVSIFVIFVLAPDKDISLETWSTLNAQGAVTEPSFWAVSVLAGVAVLCLPRQFHLVAVETATVGELSRARWLFPVYLTLTCLFVAPIAAFGLQSQTPVNPDTLLLSLPISSGQTALTLFAFIGGFSAASAMIILSAYVVGTMITSEVVAPLLFNFRTSWQRKDDYGAAIMALRRALILLVVVVASFYVAIQSRTLALASFGMDAFTLIAQLAPALIFGLYTRFVHARGAVAGMVAGSTVWLVLVLAPSLFPESSVLINAEGMTAHWFASLGLDRFSRTAALSLLANTGSVVAFSLLFRPQLADRVQANTFVPRRLTAGDPVTGQRSLARVGDVRRLLKMVLDEKRSATIVEEHRHRLSQPLHDGQEAPGWMVAECERAIATVLGASSARSLMISVSEHRRLEIEDVVHLVGGTAQALRFNRSLLFTSLENLAHGISVVDAHLCLVAWNQRYIEFFDYPSGMIRVGAPVEELVRFNIERGAAGPGNVERMIRRRVEHLRRGTAYTTRRTLNNRVLEVAGQPLPEGGFVTTFSDITEHVARKDALEQAKENLERLVQERTAQIVKINRQLEEAMIAAEEANSEKTQFLVTVGHDILQPLGAARMFLSAALDPQHSEPPRTLLESLSDSLLATEELIADLYEIAKLDRGAMQPEITAVPIDPLLRQLVAETGSQAAQKSLDLRYVPTSVSAWADASYLRRIVGNFLNNAVKYSLSGRVVVGVRRRGSQISIQVWDEGPGIPEREHESIFKDLYRREDARKQPGSGLGLSMARRMASALGAQIDLNSKPGRGSCFSVTLPQAWSTLNERKSTSSEADWSFAGVRILYLDDEPTNLEAFQALVCLWGAAVEVFHRIPDALNFVTACPAIDVMLVDYELRSDNNGIEVASLLQQHLRRQVPTVIVTAQRDITIQKAAQGQGFTFLQKPLRSASLRSTLQHLIDPSLNKR